MEPTKPKLPREAIELYNDFIHGEISRRDFMDGIQRVAAVWRPPRLSMH
jgi:carboxymethylenebutenolidase